MYSPHPEQPFADAVQNREMRALTLDSDTPEPEPEAVDDHGAVPESLVCPASGDELAMSYAVVVVGASGDLAKKKTYPALFKLFLNGLLPSKVAIVGYARSSNSDEAFREKIRPWLEKLAPARPERLEAFLGMMTYCTGQYNGADDFASLHLVLSEWEQASGATVHNRLFYLAIPPSVFGPTAKSIKLSAMAVDPAWTRVIVEKPFGHDLASSDILDKELGELLKEEQIYRIDHYLGKEMVQNLSAVRFGNSIFEPLWNRHNIASVAVTFKEDITVEGRAGYFNSIGLIRDVMQNHLLQLVTLVAMEPPVSLSSEDIRDEKVKVLRAMKPLTLADMVLGQYEGYCFDPEVPDDSKTETYAMATMHIENARWAGVPFIVKCGKAMNDKKVEIRVQFKASPLPYHREGQGANRNELVMRVQPDEAMYLKTNMKRVGKAGMVTAELDLSYHKRFPDAYVPEAYERLIHDCFMGEHANFVRNDELRESWKLFDGLLKEMKKVKPTPLIYKRGTRGPSEGDLKLQTLGVQRTHGYVGPSANYY